MTYSTSVDVTNIPQTRALLARFEPDLLKQLDRRITAVARNLKTGAQARFGATGVAGAGYRIRTRTGKGKFVKSVTTTQGSVSPGERWSSSPGVLAAVLELANAVRDAKPQNVERTRNMLATLRARYGEPGRFLWAEWDDQETQAMADVERTILDVEAEYSARLKGA